MTKWNNESELLEWSDHRWRSEEKKNSNLEKKNLLEERQ